ncbi:MAG: RES family NAD+ phosphorylase [Chitinophagaceae bacterium]
MEVFRIVQQEIRTRDLSGTGAFKVGGRWNSRGVYMLYSSSNSSLALLENLVHFDRFSIPDKLFLMTLEVSEKAPLLLLKDTDHPNHWQQLDQISNRRLGDAWMRNNKHLAIRVRSAVNPTDYNYLLNPLFAGFTDLVKVKAVQALDLDARLKGA